MKRNMLDNYFKTTFKKCVINVEPKSEYVGIGKKLIAYDSSISLTLRGERRKKIREWGLKKIKIFINTIQLYNIYEYFIIVLYKYINLQTRETF
jgi:hypothetical protein